MLARAGMALRCQDGTLPTDVLLNDYFFCPRRPSRFPRAAIMHIRRAPCQAPMLEADNEDGSNIDGRP